MRGIAGEDVRAARAVLVQEPAAIGDAPLQLGGILRAVRDDRRVAVLLPPAEGRHVVVVAVQQARLAGARLRRPVGLPAPQPILARVSPSGRASGRCRRGSRGAARRRPGHRSRGTRSPERRRPAARRAAPPSSPAARGRRTRSCWSIDRIAAARVVTAVSTSTAPSAAAPPRMVNPLSSSETSDRVKAFNDERAEAERGHREWEREADEQRPDEPFQPREDRRREQRQPEALDAHPGTSALASRSPRPAREPHRQRRRHAMPAHDAPPPTMRWRRNTA